jgi:hypothetical protein
LSIRLVESGKKRKRLTEAELEVRKQEDELFDALAKPPKVLEGLAGMLSNPQNTD